MQSRNSRSAAQGGRTADDHSIAQADYAGKSQIATGNILHLDPNDPSLNEPYTLFEAN